MWKHYPVMLCLDIPFQIINFVLFGLFSDYVIRELGYDQNILTRLFCGTICGMISAGLTCPLDVAKTRIVARDRAASQALKDNKQRSDLGELGALNDNLNTTITTKNPSNNNVLKEMIAIYQQEGPKTLFLGLGQRLLYTGLANGIRLAAYGTTRSDLTVKSFDRL